MLFAGIEQLLDLILGKIGQLRFLHLVLAQIGQPALLYLLAVLLGRVELGAQRQPQGLREGGIEAITPTGLRWPDGREEAVDIILWATGFRSALDHLSPLQLREENGGIRMTGRLATQVARDPRVHLVGYGPSASTIGANRAGAAAARELVDYLRLETGTG